MFDEIYHNHDWNSHGVYGGKLQICEKVKIDFLIDDAFKTAIEFASADIPVLLFNQPWNQVDKLPENVTRVKDWNEVVQFINTQTI